MPSATLSDPFQTRDTFQTGSGPVGIYRLDRLEQQGLGAVSKLPFSMRVLLEAVLRNCDGYEVTENDVKALASWNAAAPAKIEIPFKPARVVLQDFTGVPCVVDLAAMRSAMKRLGGDPKRINPLIPVDLVIDHSVQVDYFGRTQALETNVEIEFERNPERYEFLRWGQKALANFRAVPPNVGIVHQVNLEYLAKVVFLRSDKLGPVAFPDSLVGTDSHTTMINGLGVVGWGVGGIEAEAVMLGQPLYMLMPQVVGFKLTGWLRDGVTATDLVLVVTQMLRKKGVVDKFVEFYGPGVSTMSLPDRATIGNMAPEYGATMGFFPTDDETLRYLERTGRGDAAKLVERYAKEQGLFRTDASTDPEYSDTLALDLSDVDPSLAGPKRPQDRVPLRDMKSSFRKTLTAPVKERGYGLAESEVGRTAKIPDADATLGQGAVVIAAITSCTNTSNPSVMVGAGLLAKKAVERGLTVKPYVKTSMAPGSKVVTEYLQTSGLIKPLETLGFNVVGYGCTTCIAAGTPVLMSDGTARRIEDLPANGGARLFGPDRDRRLALATQAERMDQGLRDCVTLVLQDGRTLVCTPDHEVLRVDGRWVRADRLELEKDRVVVGLEAPLDEVGEDENGYELRTGGFVFSMETNEARLRTLAFARLLGHLLCDGSISVNGQGRMNAGQAVDREVMLDDIERITGKRPAGTQYDERKWSIALPKELTAAICTLEGVRVGLRIDQPARLPAFVLEERCPKSVVREFLGGLFGADGWAPTLGRQGADERDAILEPPAYSQTAKPDHVPQLRAMMSEIVGLLARCGVETDGYKLYDYPTRRSASTYAAAQDGVPRTEVRLSLPGGPSFVERIGYRYCVDKSLRAAAAGVYWRTIDGIHEQRLEMAQRITSSRHRNPSMTCGEARRAAATALLEHETAVFAHYSLLEGHDRFDRLPSTDARKFQPLHRESCGFPSPVELFEQIRARDRFAALEPRVEDKRYCLEKDVLTLPTLALRVIDRRPAGRREVFDLAIDDVHAFVAGSVAVHNCIGNSGPLPDPIAAAITEHKLVAAAVLSGNRNFEGRINPHTRANYLASPPLVVAYALAGTVDIDLEKDPLGTGKDGK